MSNVERWLLEALQDEPLKKEAAELTYAQRQRLESKKPQSFAWIVKDPRTGEVIDKKYPVHDKRHAINAEVRFAQHYDKIPPKDRPEVAKRIYNALKRFGVSPTSPVLLRYVLKAGKEIPQKELEHVKKSAEDVLAMRKLIASAHAEEYDHALQDLEKTGDFERFAQKVYEIDEKAGVIHEVDTLIPDVYEAIDPLLEKQAEYFIGSVPITWGVIQVLKEHPEYLERYLEKRAAEEVVNALEGPEDVENLTEDKRAALAAAVSDMLAVQDQLAEEGVQDQGGSLGEQTEEEGGAEPVTVITEKEVTEEEPVSAGEQPMEADLAEVIKEQHKEAEEPLSGYFNDPIFRIFTD